MRVTDASCDASISCTRLSSPRSVSKARQERDVKSLKMGQEQMIIVVNISIDGSR